MPACRPLLNSALLLVFAFLLAATPLPAHAQSPLTAAPADSSESAEPTDAVIAPLLDVLRDEAARDRLIRALEQAAPEGETLSVEADAPVTLAARLAAITRTTINETLSIGSAVIADMSGLTTLVDGRATLDGGRIAAVLAPLLATVAISLGLYFLAKRLLRRALSTAVLSLRERGPLAAMALMGLHFLAEILALAIAYIATGAASALLLGDLGVSIHQSLYLNAFLVTGVTAILIRVVTGIVEGDYAVLRLAAPVRQMMRERGIRLAAILIYGIAFVVPAANALISFTVGRSLRVVIYTIAAIYAVNAIRAISRLQRATHDLPLSEPQEEGDAAVDEALPEPVQSAVLQLWPLVAYAYVGASYVIALSQPAFFVDFVGGATLKTAAALVLGGLVLRGCGYLSTL
ncbi:MAG: hypothetical protein Q8S27_01030, partial [Hoeflea sp.]|nr:hypothetical protein [Hoeflea sp.]